MSSAKLVNIFYHTVSDDNIALTHIIPLYKPKTLKQFISDLDYMLKHFSPVSAYEVLQHQRGGKTFNKPSFHLSFDDGLSEIYYCVMPVLLNKGIPATIFVNSKFVDNKDLFYRYKAALLSSAFKEALSIRYSEKERLDEIARKTNTDFENFLHTRKPYLTTEQIKEMQNKGFTVGGHSAAHPNYAQISLDEQIRQTVESCNYVKENFNETKSFFAFPFSEYSTSQAFFDKIYNDVDLTFGISALSTAQNGRHLGRIDMENYGKNARISILRARAVKFIKQFI